MDADRFDALARQMSSRRQALSAAIGAMTLLGLTDEASARKRHKKPCKHWKVNFCGSNTCATYRTSSCGDKKHCKCRRGQTCLPNKSCGLACPTECPQEPFACSCPASGDQFCLRSDLACEQTPTRCASITDCPIGQACAETACGPGGATEKRCVRLCHPVPV